MHQIMILIVWQGGKVLAFRRYVMGTHSLKYLFNSYSETISKSFKILYLVKWNCLVRCFAWFESFLLCYHFIPVSAIAVYEYLLCCSIKKDV